MLEGLVGQIRVLKCRIHCYLKVDCSRGAAEAENDPGNPGGTQGEGGGNLGGNPGENPNPELPLLYRNFPCYIGTSPGISELPPPLPPVPPPLPPVSEPPSPGFPRPPSAPPKPNLWLL